MLPLSPSLLWDTSHMSQRYCLMLLLCGHSGDLPCHNLGYTYLSSPYDAINSIPSKRTWVFLSKSWIGRDQCLDLPLAAL